MVLWPASRNSCFDKRRAAFRSMKSQRLPRDRRGCLFSLLVLSPVVLSSGHEAVADGRSDQRIMKLFSALLGLVLMVAACGRNERMDTLYAQRCFGCHGASGQGDGPMAELLPIPPPDFRETVERRSNSQIRRAIAEGRGTMPAFSPALRPSEISDMLQMVRFLSREGRDTRWWERFDTLVVAHCSLPWETILGYDDFAED